MASIIRRVTISIATGRRAAVNRIIMLAATTPGADSHTMRKIGGTFFRELKRSCQSCLGIHTVSAFVIIFFVVIRIPVESIVARCLCRCWPKGLTGINLGMDPEGRGHWLDAILFASSRLLHCAL